MRLVSPEFLIKLPNLSDLGQVGICLQQLGGQWRMCIMSQILPFACSEDRIFVSPLHSETYQMAYAFNDRSRQPLKSC